ncbi:hypothetical protein [Cellulomonas denverensis]|uniref:Uncharacterized protein n=1 Tax=Cellulomonas denverensis TaxID=264297 RepID=A0A7X6KS85_9CELL|nr:hypothetical protein [Cellulomonas denverensis]
MDLAAAQQARSRLHSLSADVGWDLGHVRVDPGSTRVGEAIEAWLVHQSQHTGALAARVWAGGDAVAEAAGILADTDREIAVRGHGLGTMVAR